MSSKYLEVWCKELPQFFFSKTKARFFYSVQYTTICFCMDGSHMHISKFEVTKKKPWSNFAHLHISMWTYMWDLTFMRYQYVRYLSHTCALSSDKQCKALDPFYSTQNSLWHDRVIINQSIINQHSTTPKLPYTVECLGYYCNLHFLMEGTRHVSKCWHQGLHLGALNTSDT